MLGNIPPPLTNYGSQIYGGLNLLSLTKPAQNGASALHHRSVFHQSTLNTRLLKIRHLYGIWSGLIPYRLRLDTLSEYPEP